MINMKLTLDKRRQRNDSTYPIVFRVSYKGKSRDISSGFTCKLSDWDSRNSHPKVSSEALKVLSNRIQEQRLKYQEKLLGFERNLLESHTDVQEIKDYLTGKVSQKSTVHEYWIQEIQRLEKVQKYGNARNYKSALGGITGAVDLDIPFTKVDYKWLVQLETKLRSKDVKPNSVAVYMRTLRALYNKAINSGVIDTQDYPFRRYKIKSEPTSPRVASLEELQKFFAHVPADNRNIDPWNYGRLIFMLRGINFTDLALLTKDNIKHGRIIYKRSKTHKMYSVEILPLVQKLIEQYKDDNRVTLFPILTNDEYQNKAGHHKRVGQQRKNCNKWLRRIGQELMIKENLSTYVFRYSHANACKSLGYSKDLISESLGHAYGLAVSSCYLENYNVELLDEMNRKVVYEVNGGV
jgi:integrase